MRQQPFPDLRKLFELGGLGSTVTACSEAIVALESCPCLIGEKSLDEIVEIVEELHGFLILPSIGVPRFSFIAVSAGAMGAGPQPMACLFLRNLGDVRI